MEKQAQKEGGGKLKVMIAEKLSELKMSQRDLARQTGIHHITINRWVRGERIPKISDAFRVAQALDCSITDLYVP